MTKKLPGSRHPSRLSSFNPTPARLLLGAAFCFGVASLVISNRTIGQGLLASCVLLAGISLVMNLRWTPNPWIGERRRRR